MRLQPRAVFFGAAAVAATAMLACTLIVPTSELQCSTDADCRARGAQFAGASCVANLCQAASNAEGGTSPDGGAAGDGGVDPWACLDQTPTPSPASSVDVQIVLYDSIGSVMYGGSVDGGSDLNIVGYTPQPGVTVAACNSLDPSCTTPIAGPTSTDDGGLVTFDLPGSFSGFFALERSDSVPELFYPGARLLAGEPMVSFPTSMTSTMTFAELQAALMLPANTDTDAGPGVLSVTQFDCNDHHAPGVVISSSPSPQKTLYLMNNFPSSSATSTAPEGAAALVNVPSGSVGLTSTLPAQNNRVLSSVNVFVRPGRITLVYLRPRTR
jgi:hypothetical protein